MAGTIVIGSCGYLLNVFLSHPKTLPEESTDLVNAISSLDIKAVESHLFDSEKDTYKLDESKRMVLASILKRGMSKIDILKIHSPEFQKAVGSGAVWIRYKCHRTSNAHDGLMPSYLTPTGVHTGLLDVLLFVWKAEMYNDLGDGDPRIPDILESMHYGLGLDSEALKKAGFQKVSQDGRKFVDIDSLVETTNKNMLAFTDGT